MDIGTAKPSERERGGIRHHLIDILDIDPAVFLRGFHFACDRVREGYMLPREDPRYRGRDRALYRNADIRHTDPPLLRPMRGCVRSCTPMLLGTETRRCGNGLKK